jgi:hypothetical protein
MATIVGIGPNVYALGTAQTGDVTTDTLDRGADRRPMALVITSTVGAEPTVTANIKGSVDGTTFYNIPYSLVATPSTWVIAAITISTATTTTYLLQGDQAWRYLRVEYTANTNVTVTTTAHI